MRFCTSLVIILFLVCCAITTNAIAADEVSIGILLQNGEEFKDKVVTVHGTVTHSEAASEDDSTLSRVKGSYDLSDGKGKSIKVITMHAPPPLGVERVARGKVTTKYGTDPVLIETGGPPISWYLIAALGGLAIVAIVLVALIVKKPASKTIPVKATVKAQPSEPSIVSPTPTVRPQASISGRCPKCGHENTPDSQWCEECGESLKAQTVRPERTGAATSMEVKQNRTRETVMYTPGSENARPLANLTVIEGEGANKALTYALSKGQHKIGRSDDMNFILPEETVSRYHATVWWEEGKFYLGDEDSTSGTLVNGQRVKKSAPTTLNDNDTIQLGKTKLLFRLLPGNAE
jgi:uncharacterized OB-fold protein